MNKFHKLLAIVTALLLTVTGVGLFNNVNAGEVGGGGAGGGGGGGGGSSAGYYLLVGDDLSRLTNPPQGVGSASGKYFYDGILSLINKNESKNYKWSTNALNNYIEPSIESALKESRDRAYANSKLTAAQQKQAADNSRIVALMISWNYSDYPSDVTTWNMNKTAFTDAFNKQWTNASNYLKGYSSADKTAVYNRFIQEIDHVDKTQGGGLRVVAISYNGSEPRLPTYTSSMTTRAKVANSTTYFNDAAANRKPNPDFKTPGTNWLKAGDMAGVQDEIIMKSSDGTNESLPGTMTFNYGGPDLADTSAIVKSARKSITVKTNGTNNSPVFLPSDLGMTNGWEPGKYWFNIAVPAGGNMSSPSNHTGHDDINEYFYVSVQPEKPKTPAITVEKWDTESGFPAGDRDTMDKALEVDADTPVEITYDITNTGDVKLIDVQLNDAVTLGDATVGEIVYPEGWDHTLEPGAKISATATITGITEDHTNLVTVTGKSDVDGTPVKDDDPWNAVPKPKDVVEPNLGITVEKYDTESGFPAGDRDTMDEAIEVIADTPVEVSYKITNTGDAKLINVQLADSVTLGDAVVGDIVYPEGWDHTLEPGANITATATITGITGDHTNLVTVTATDENETPVTDDDPWNAKVKDPGNPAITVEKWDTESGFPAGDRDTMDEALIVQKDASVEVTYDIVNNGDVKLVDVQLSDAITVGDATVGEIVYPEGWDHTLEPGDKVSATATITGITGDHTNLVTVTGKSDVDGTPVTDDDPWNAKVEKPTLTVEKYDTESGFPAGDRDDAEQALMVAEDSETSLSYEIVNKGNVKIIDIVLEDVVTVGEGVVENIVYPEGWDGTLEPGQKVTVTGTLKGVTGDHTNVVKVTGKSELSGEPITAEDPWNAKVEKPEITIEKYDSESGLELGDRDEATDALQIGKNGEIVINYDVTNNGNVALVDVTLEDITTNGNGEVDEIIPPEGWNGLLEIGETVTFTAVLKGVTEGDHTNVATVTGKSELSGKEVKDDDPWNGKVEQPDLIVEKWDTDSGFPEGDRDTPESARIISSGEEIEITYDVTNTGDVALVDVTLEDVTTIGEGVVEDFVYPEGWEGRIEAGETVSITAILKGITTGEHANVVTVNAKSELSGEPLTSEDPWHAKVEEVGIDVEKYDIKSGRETGDRDEAKDALVITSGEDVELGFDVTNTGNVTLVDVKLEDLTTNGNGKIEKLVEPEGWEGRIEPGQTVTFTATLKGVTEGTHTNNVTATGKSELSGKEVKDEDPWNAKVPPVPVKETPPPPVKEEPKKPTPKVPILSDSGANLIPIGIAVASLIGGAWLALGGRKRNGTDSE